MPPRTGKGRGRPRRVPIPEDEESAYSAHVPQFPEPEQAPFPPPGMEMPANVPPEMWTAFMAYWNAQNQTPAQPEQVPMGQPPNEPMRAPPVPTAPAVPAESSRPVYRLSKLIKEAR